MRKKGILGGRRGDWWMEGVIKEATKQERVKI